MKKILLVITFSLSCALFGETTVEIVKIDVPYAWEYKQGINTVTFSDGSAQIFRNIKFSLERKDLDVAISEYGNTHSDLVTALNSTDPESGERYFTTAQANNTLSVWEVAVANAIANGESEQLMKNVDAIKSLSQTTEEAAKEVQNVYKQTVTKMSEIRTGVNTMVSSIRSESSSAISSLQSQLTAATQAQSTKMQQLAAAMADGSTATAAQQAQLKAEVEKASIAVAGIQKAIATLNKSATIVVPVAVDGYLHYSVYTNDMNRLSAWLCATNKIGTFSAARNPYNPSYVTKSMNDYNSKIGVMQYMDIAMGEYYDSHKQSLDNQNVVFKEGFYEDYADNNKTNVFASFIAPKNWADGSTITCTDGVYRAETYTNALKTLRSLLNNGSSTGVPDIPSDNSISQNSIWNVNNSDNPANASFDKTDMGKLWNKILVTGDANKADNMPSGTRKLYSVEFLGGKSSSYGNAMTLYGFWNSKKYSVPYVDRDSEDTVLTWEGKTVSDSYLNDPVLPKTIDTFEEPDAESENAEKRKYLTLRGFSTASVGNVPYKMSSTELGWTNIVTGSGAPANVDDASITTNTAHGAMTTGVASLYGFSTASVGKIPYKKSSTEIGWINAGGGSALRFIGTDNSTVVLGAPASATNTVTFASAQDSNVNVNVSGSSSSATITIGVYYK